MWYRQRWELLESSDKKTVYEKIKASYNAKPNGADFIFLSRSCYGGVVRFRKEDGYMSTPCGIHDPISPDSFDNRVDIWAQRTNNTVFINCEFQESMLSATEGDVIYCDPPYSDTQAIVYGAQNFSLAKLFEVIKECKAKGVFVLLSIDKLKKSGNHICDIRIPNGLFEREINVNCLAKP
jgi:DNA adenine methylase